ncbi:S8 family serine peptidase [Nocardioides sp. SYSU DS0663]|uniref:S8 family serine peptidase n=1 Tax=Nocardioides sp. SYSU DS0663 TaxID=3416445 RepID=UPI003F4BA5FA
MTRPRPRRRRAAAALTAGLAAGAAAGVLLVPAPAHGDALDCTGIAADAVDPAVTADPSRPLELINVRVAHDWFAQRGREPGEGVAVAVVDSGIAPRAVAAGLPVVARHVLTPAPAVVDQHGTAVAGLVAGPPRERDLPVGIAWGSELVDIKVYDAAPPADDSQVGVEPARVAAGLAWVADRADDLGIGVVNVSLAMTDDPRVRRAVQRLVAADVVVVAASGNRPTDETDPLHAVLAAGGDEGDGGPGEDVRGKVFPAAYPGVVAVTATADGSGEPDARGAVLPNSDVDVAAPVFGAVSYGVDGGTCGLPHLHTSWAAAEVSAVVALVRSAHPEETAEQVVARLVATASGTPGVRTVLSGAGVVQPYEAIVRPLGPDAGGRLARLRGAAPAVGPATAVPEQADVLAGARDQVVWWGLLGGGALALAWVLRPLLARRR